MGSFEHDFPTLHYIQSGILVLLTLQCAKGTWGSSAGSLRWVQSPGCAGSGSRQELQWVLPLVPVWESAAHQLVRTGQPKHLGLEGLQLFRTHRGVQQLSCAHTHTFVFWVCCTKRGCSHVQSVASGTMGPSGCVHFVAEVIRYQLQVCCTFKAFTGCYIDCECCRRRIGCSCVLVLLALWVPFFFFFYPAKFKY